MFIGFQTLRYKNFLATGNQFQDIDLDTVANTLVYGINGSGKCFCINTPIRLRNTKTGEILETTIGDFYAAQKIQDPRRKDR